jgi:hypothetical protein
MCIVWENHCVPEATECRGKLGVDAGEEAHVLIRDPTLLPVAGCPGFTGLQV